MIVRLRMEIQDKIGNDVNYYFDTIDTHRLYAMATNNVREWVKLNVNGADYEYIAAHGIRSQWSAAVRCCSRKRSCWMYSSYSIIPT